jgi:glycosyltransferase involved in cell wall biosynthesis
VLRKAGARIVVVFHDAQPFGGDRLVDRTRRFVQVRVMRNAAALSDYSVMTVPTSRVGWLPESLDNVCFIPVGANLPQPLLEQDHNDLHEPPTIAIYSITGGSVGDDETDQIIRVVRRTAQELGKLRLLVFGRYAEVREESLRNGLQDCEVEVCVEGVIEGDALVERFASSDVLLFLRGAVSSRRGSAIAGIACGLPVVGLRGPETDSLTSGAGVILFDDIPNREELANQFGEALIKVFSDDAYRQDLAVRSRTAQRDSFSWSAIARRYAGLFNNSGQS